MKQKTLRHRFLSALLAVAMMAALAGAALAAPIACPVCRGNDLTAIPVAVATCNTEGSIEYTCNSCQYVWEEKTPLDPTNHEAQYKDNGDGSTHTGTCHYHPSAYSDVKEPHDFVNGRCTKCATIDYSKVSISVPKNLVVYANLGDENAKISLGDVILSLGNADITDDYELSYNWYYINASVGSGETYALPASITAEEGDYSYVCFVMATPKKGLNMQPLNASCNVTVRVRELVSAYAAVSTEDASFELDGTDGRNEASVVEQIYDAVYDASPAGYPAYVVFDSLPTSKLGKLNCTAGRRYSLDNSSSSSYLGSVAFVPEGDRTGTYVVNFTAYDTRGKDFPGTLTITVERTLGDMDLLYTTAKGEAVTFDEEDFSDFWLDTYESGELTSISFTQLPSSSAGTLYYGYTSASRPGTRVRTNEAFYYAPTRDSQNEIDLTFVPGSKFTGYVSIPFAASGKNNRGNPAFLEGRVYLFVIDGDVENVSYSVSSGGTVNLSAKDFLDVYQKATGSKNASFYIQFLDLPASGALYVDYTGSSRDTKLSSANTAGYLFYYTSSREHEIGDVTFVPGTSARDSASYIAYDAKGELQYIGIVDFTRGDLTVTYSCTSTGVKFNASDFEKVLGVSGSAVTLSFTQPDSGTLYYNYTGSAGAKVTSKDSYNLSTGASSVSSLTYIPAAGKSGTVSIPFTGTDANGSKFSGTVKITVTNTTTPAKTFRDVKSTDWYYTYITDLATAGVINGYEDGTFRPNGEVTYGEALKMILLAAGYDEQAPTSKHWASGYLTKALADGLLSTNVANLDSKISRNVIAEIAAKALKLPASSRTTSPFTDVAVNSTYATYVLSLYDAKIVEGNPQKDGTYKYYGVNSIVRSEMAAIIWRINNYNN